MSDFKPDYNIESDDAELIKQTKRKAQDVFEKLKLISSGLTPLPDLSLELSGEKSKEKSGVRAADTAASVNKKKIALVLAESCTAGMVSSLLAGFPGASNVLWGSYICYTQEAKVSMLGLDNDRLDAYGLVSRETACAMAAGAMKKSGANIAAAVTGLAGPSGDGSSVPVGTVWVAVAGGIKTNVKEFHFTGTRNSIRIRAAAAVLDEILNVLPECII